MSKKVLATVFVFFLLISTAFAIAHPDGLYQPKTTIAQSPVPEKNPSNLFGGFGTAFNIDAATQSPENAEVDQAQVSASFSAFKGPINFTYTHSRNYARYVDAFSGQIAPDFQGTVNNQVSVGFTLQPEELNNNLSLTTVSGSD